MGKNIVTAKQRHGSQNPLFPHSIAVSGLKPLQKVWVDYLPLPKNQFLVKVNDFSYYTLVKEELDFDPTQIEAFKCRWLKLNEEVAHRGAMAWILEEFEGKINKVYKGEPLESFEIRKLDCKSQVANEVFDVMASQDLADDSLKKLSLSSMQQKCFPIEDDVVSRLAQSCIRL